MTISARTIFKVLSLSAIFIGVLMMASIARRELVWVGTAFFLAVALNPAVAQLTRVMPRRSRLLATSGVFLILLAVLSFLLVALVPPLVRQTEQLSANAPRYVDQLAHGHSFVSDQIRNLNLVGRIRESQGQLLNYATAASGSFFSIIKRIFSSFAAGLTVLGLTYFMLLEGPGWVEAFWRIVPDKRREHGRRLAGQMYDAVTGYVTGNVLTSLLAGGLTSIMLAIVGVPYAIPLGMVLAIFDLLPLVGATIGAAIVLAVSLFASLAAAVVMLLFFAVYQQVENHLLQPVVYGRTVQMSPLLVLVSVLIGAGVGGILGAIVAIPVGASLQIVVRDLAKRHVA